MSIDVLAYELKYKNDQMVLDLLREYQDLIVHFKEQTGGHSRTIFEDA